MTPYRRLEALVRSRTAWTGSLDALPQAVREGVRRTRLLARAPECNSTALRSLRRSWEFCERLCDLKPILHSVLNIDLGRWAEALLRARRPRATPARKES